MWIDRRVLLAATALSVLLNLFLVGLVGSHLAGPLKAADHALILDAHVEALPAEERARYRSVMDSHEAAITSARRVQQAARNSVQAELAAPTFDAEKVKRAFEALRRARDALQETTQTALAEAMATLPAASRSALVAR